MLVSQTGIEPACTSSKDYAAMIEGHGGALDRIDWLYLGAVFFHLTRSSIFPQSDIRNQDP